MTAIGAAGRGIIATAKANPLFVVADGTGALTGGVLSLITNTVLFACAVIGVHTVKARRTRSLTDTSNILFAGRAARAHIWRAVDGLRTSITSRTCVGDTTRLIGRIAFQTAGIDLPDCDIEARTACVTDKARRNGTTRHRIDLSHILIDRMKIGELSSTSSSLSRIPVAVLNLPAENARTR